MRYFIYCRKSSEAEDRQVASIGSQLTTLTRTFGDRANIEIARIYEEAYSAKAPGRPVFGEMMSAIEKGGADGIIAWAPDRLARNSIDGGRIVYLLDQGVLKDMKFATYTFENNSQGKFMLQIMFGQSKYYSDALSENVKRGLRTRIEKGWHPSRPPIGYLNDPATRTIARDPERFMRVRQIFDMYLSGELSAQRISKIARDDWSLRTRRCRRSGGSLIPTSYVHKILTNPFYAGIIVWNDRTYSGAHEPVVSVDEFERVQARLRKTTTSRAKTRRFAFTGMIRCGECSFLVTAEEKTNRHGSHYTYYHCTKRRMDYRCKQPSISRALLDGQIKQFLCRITIPERVHQWARCFLSENRQTESEALEERRKMLRCAAKRAEAALENLTSLRIHDTINNDEFLHERRKVQIEHERIRQQLEDIGNLTGPFEPLETIISFRTRAVKWFRDGGDDAKRLILRIVGSNLVLKDKVLSIAAKKPFQLSLNNCSQPLLCSWRDDVRTLLSNNDTELLQVLDDIKLLENRLGIVPSPAPRQSVRQGRTKSCGTPSSVGRSPRRRKAA